MLAYTTRPISDRSPFGIGEHKSSQFTVSWSAALDLLEREYNHLHGRQLVIEVDVRERDIRNDGGLRADAKADTPAVRVAFDSMHGPLQYATDEFIRPSWRRTGMQQDWQHNVYAIAKSLEALRMVDRYGVSRRGQQYTGWKAIGAGTGLAPTAMTTDVALDVIRDETGAAFDRLGSLAKAVRFARFASHPDRHNGDRSRYNAVDEAIQVLERAGKL